eukprot:9057584-Ditylum_brightwellii.AAC.1
MMSWNKNKAAQDIVLPATFLWWDVNDDAFEEALEMAESIEMEKGPNQRRAGKEKGQKWANKGKTTGLVTIDMSDHKQMESVKEKMQERGERAMDNKMGFQMDVQNEWAMTDI